MLVIQNQVFAMVFEEKSRRRLPPTMERQRVYGVVCACLAVVTGGTVFPISKKIPPHHHQFYYFHRIHMYFLCHQYLKLRQRNRSIATRPGYHFSSSFWGCKTGFNEAIIIRYRSIRAFPFLLVLVLLLQP